MPITKQQNFQIVNDAALAVMGMHARTTNDVIFGAVDANFDSPFRLSAAATPNSKIYISPNEVTLSNGVGRAAPALADQILTFPASTIDFQTRGTTGGAFVITWPVNTPGYFRRAGFTFIDTGRIQVIFSSEVADVAYLPNPGGLFVEGLPLGWVDLEATSTTQFKTQGSASNVIENAVAGHSRIHLFWAGAGGSGTGSGTVTAPVIVQEALSGVINGANRQFALSRVPQNEQSVVVFVDGLKDENWNLSNQTITFFEGSAPEPSQSVEAFYIAQSDSIFGAVQETPSGTVDGTNDTFTLTGQPITQQSIILTVNGIVRPITEWNLITGTAQSAIKFLAGAIPEIGQHVSVFYLTNVYSGGSSAPSSGSGSGSSLTPATIYPILSSADISNGFITLPNIPSVASSVCVDVIGGVAQVYGSDFVVSGSQLSWAGLGMAGTLEAGDRLRVFYLY